MGDDVDMRTFIHDKYGFLYYEQVYAAAISQLGGLVVLRTMPQGLLDVSFLWCSVTGSYEVQRPRPTSAQRGQLHARGSALMSKQH